MLRLPLTPGSEHITRNTETALVVCVSYPGYVCGMTDSDNMCTWVMETGENVVPGESRYDIVDSR